ncbi:unnamed protein product [Caenorhabditis auriculariae]|uniref:Ig-like domain-containing protein n=1 Tax=Caenorhabditis auriculariae TaxID=2777116 RepID=A0A8S1H4U7_9PELO|nr:unnamed protein product [Caenorhabditis auriculariae]
MTVFKIELVSSLVSETTSTTEMTSTQSRTTMEFEKKEKSPERKVTFLSEEEKTSVTKSEEEIREESKTETASEEAKSTVEKKKTPSPPTSPTKKAEDKPESPTKKKKSPTPETKKSSEEKTVTEEVTSVTEVNVTSSEQEAKAPESPTKKKKTPSPPTSPTKKVSEEKPESPSKKKKSPTPEATKVSEDKTDVTEESKTVTEVTSSDQETKAPESPTKKKKSPSPPTSPTKKASEENPQSPTEKKKSPTPESKKTSIETTNIAEESKTVTEVTVTSSEQEVKAPESPTKKKKSPSPPTSPTKKASEEKPESPIKKKKSLTPEATKTSEEKTDVTEESKTVTKVSVTSSEQEVRAPESPTKEKKSPTPESKKALDENTEVAEEITSVTDVTITSSEQEAKAPESPIKKKKTPSPPTSPTKKSEDKPESPTKKKKSPTPEATKTSEETTGVTEESKTVTEVSVTSSEQEAKAPESPVKKKKSPTPTSPTKKASEEKPESPTEKKKSQTPEATKTLEEKTDGTEESKTVTEVSVTSSEQEAKAPESPIKKKKSPTPESLTKKASEEKPESPIKKKKSPTPEANKTSEETTTEESKNVTEVNVTSSEQEGKAPEPPLKKKKTPSPPTSPTKKASEDKPESPIKKNSPTPETKKTSDEKQEVEEITSVTDVTITSSEQDAKAPESPIKKKKSPTPESPTKKKKSPTPEAKKTSEETTAEESKTVTEVSITSSEQEEKAPESPIKKKKTPSPPTSPTKKASEDKPESPIKKKKSPTPESTMASEEKTTTTEESKTVTEVSVTSSEQEVKAPESPIKKKKTPSPPTSPTKKSEDKPESPTKKKKSPTPEATKTSEETTGVIDESKTVTEVSVTSSEQEAKAPESPIKKKKSPTPTSPTEKASEEKPESPTKKKKSPTPEAKKTCEEKPPAPKITRDLKSQTGNKTDLAHFEVVVEHATEVKWFLDGKEITKSHGVTVSNDDKFEFRASIDTTIFGSGTVSVVASNATGSVETKCELKVLEEQKETKKPEFTDKLRDIEVVRGETVQQRESSGELVARATQVAKHIAIPNATMAMDVIALHSPQYKWYLNGEELKSGVNGVTITTVENKSSLKIENVQESQTGRVTVEASNEVGKSESSAQMRVVPPATAPIIDGPRSVTIKESETAEFKKNNPSVYPKPQKSQVTITGSPEPTVKWYINEKIVEESTTTTTVKTENIYTLKITETKTSHTGTVKVTAQNSAGSDSKTADLKVERGVTAPTFKGTLSDKDAKEGEPLRWDVEVEGDGPGNEVTWLLNGKPLADSAGVQISNDGNGKHNLTIAEAKPDMSGKIAVKAKNPAGECEMSASVNVAGANKKPEFTKTPQNHETTIDESVKFSAIVTGVPTPTVSWYLNEKKLEHSEEVKVKFEAETGKTSIRIFKPKIEHSGTIRVEASNVAGKVEATAQLKVDRKTEVPKFTTNMDDRQVNEGENVKYTANVEGYPEPSVAWTLNGQPAAQHPNITVTDTEGEHTIEIKQITPEQAGELSCEATNAVGTKKRDVQLAVKRVGDAPTFARNLEDRLTTEGELTLMEAKLNVVKPKPKVTWLRDGKEFSSDDHVKTIEQEDGTLQLRIVTTKLEDKGRITIRAENDFGCAECSASIGVVKGRPMAKPVFQSEIPPTNLTEGDTLDVKLLITGDPTPFVKWYINGTLVCATEDTEMTSSNGVFTLKIHGVSTDMTGKIKCVAYNKAGEASTEGPLKVIAPIPVEFETSLCDATCREGDTLKLKAVLLGEPTPVVSWYVNGKKLEESQNIKIHAEKGTYTVTIKDITCDYSGKVVCEAVNEYGKASSEAMLLVLPRGEPPDFLEWLSNVRARAGSKVVHKVVFTGDPKPHLTWYINNREIQNSSEYTIVTDDKTSTLTINSFNSDLHVGEIICKAENDAGEVSCTANMTTYTSDMFSESESEAQMEEFVGDDMTEDESFRDELHRTPTPVNAPKFITKIKDTKAKKGHEAIFECVVPDTKGVCCKWLKDGKEIELIARIRVQTRTIEGHVTEQLIIEGVTPEDAGKYTCIVENTAGTATCEASLTVIEELDKAPNKAPEFVVALQDKTVTVADKVQFECKVVGEPAPKVTWFHDSKVVTSQEVVTIEQINDVQRLTISSSDVKHQGSYSCVAENSEGTTKTEAYLTVKAQAPEFTKPLQDKTLSIGEKLILSCSVKGSPQPHVDFFSYNSTTREEIKITSSSRIAVEHDATNTHWRMVIKEVTREEITTYKAVATNSAGTATTESKVTTKTEAPVFEQGLKKTTVREKEELHMEVKVSGTEPEVQWFKDGKPVAEDSNHEIKKDAATGKHSLVIKQANLADAGNYTAKAVNPAGQVESSAEAEVTQALEKPTFVKELVSTEVKYNETATLSVSVKGVPEPTVQWLKDGAPVSVDGSHVISKSEGSGSYSITINSARLEDSGKYSCKAVNTAGEATTQANFAVVRDLQAPEFTEKLHSFKVKESETANFKVTVVGVPEPEVKWFKDDAPLNIDNSHVVAKEEGSGSYSLVIKETTTSDVGVYSCKATNMAGEATTTSSIRFEKVLVAPEFTEKLKPLEVKEKETFTASVTVTGSPQPEVKWFKDNTPVTVDGSHIVVKAEGSGHYTFTIKDATSSDVGVYSCKATNEVGEATTTANFGLVRTLVAPEFTEKLKPLEVKEKETFTASVTVTGSPQPEVKWFKDNTPVNVDGSHIVVKEEGSGHYTFTIQDATSSDVGIYSCKATNEVGEATTTANFGLVRTLVAPEFTEKLKPMEVKENEALTLSVTVTGMPTPTVQWFKDDIPIQVDNTNIIAKDDEHGHHSLTFPKARSEDVGVYSCKATNEVGEAKTTANMAIQEEIEAPMFTQGLKPMEVEAGKPLELVVSVEGKPEPEVKWLKDGVPVNIDESHIISKKGEHGQHTLVIKDIAAADVGKYSCQAVNKAGKDETIGEVKIPKYSFEKHNVEEVKPMFVEPLQETFATEGDTVVLECRVNKESHPDVKFFKNDKPVEIGPHMALDVLDDGKIKLTIHGALKEDVGKYTCEATNLVGKADTSAPLNVKFGEKVEESVMDESTQLEELSVATTATESATSKTETGKGAPEFVELLRSCTVTKGQQAVLRCKVKGEPRPKIRWVKEGKEVEMSARVRAEHKDDGTLTLTIDDVTQAEAGEYRCEAENEFGSAWTEGPIIVTLEGAPKIDGEAPDFLQPVRPAAVTVGETAVLEGKVSGKPRPTVKWYKNGKEITPNDRIKIEDLEDGTQRLTVKDAQLSDADEYRCSASNEFGDVWSDVTLGVKEPAQSAPEFVKELAAVQVKETETAKFECKVSGTEPTVKWFKDGQEVKKDARVKIESESDGTQRLVIEKSTTADQGNYRVEASNDAGTANLKAPLTVTPDETLKLKRGLNDLTIPQGTKILLSVEVEGRPKTVKWYKGTEQISSSKTTVIEQVSDHEYKLEINKSELTDSGSYRVVLSTETQSVESSSTVVVTSTAEKVSLPSFKKGLCDQIVPKGSPLVLEIEVEGKPKDVKWYKNGDELKNAKTEDLGNGKYRLTIPDFSDADVGEYSVTAGNDAGEIESKAKVTAKDDGKDKNKPEIVSGLVPTSVKQGETATFRVQVKGPVKGVKWYKNGKEIPNAKATDKGDGVYELEVPNAQLEDAADYKVVVSNDAGDADSSASLTVKLPAIEIVKGLEDKAVPKGQKVVLGVETSRKPKSVKWYKNGKEIGPDDKAKPGFDGDNKPILTIPNTGDEDAADYKIVLTDDDGNTADSSCALTVKLPGIEIVKGLEDTTVPKGQKVVLGVETNRKPKSVKWYKNGKELGPDDKAKPGFDGENKPQLTIPDAGDEDAADYKIVLTDDDGNTADSFCALTVKLPAEEPRFVKGLEDQVVPVGQPVKLEIETAGSPTTVKWYKNGKEVPASAAGKVKISKVDDNHYVLEIPSSAVDDTGDYKVEIANEAGKANSNGKLTVEPKLTFLKPLKDQTITEGENAEFAVETNAQPRSVKWYKNGQEIKPDSHFVVAGEGTKYSLVIKNAVRDDAATYKVVLTNSAGDADSSAKLTVKKPKPGLPKIIKGLEDQVVAKGASMVFEVKIEGEATDIRWLKDGKPVSAGANAVIEKIDDQTYRLTIPKADLGDAGEYTFEVSNETGKAKSEAKGKVDEKPEIVKGLQDTELAEGDDDVFKVEVSAPVRTVKWYKNGQEIKPSSHFAPKKIGPKKYELAINKAQLDDGATYKVVLGNAAGECDSSADLTVTKPNILKVIDGLKDVNVTEGEPVELKVKVEGVPKTVKWYKNGQELAPSADLKTEDKPESGEFSLTIPSSKKSDGGAYRVVLANDKGEVYSGSVVHVKAAKPKDTTSGANFLSPLKDTEVEEGDMLTLQCVVGGEPFPEVKWEKDGVPLTKDDRIAIRVALDGTATLRIRSAKKSDFGQYRVIATNEAGSATSACQVTVKDQGEQPSKPHFVIPLTSSAALPGEKKEFNVKVRGLPKPALQWFLNDKSIKFDDRVKVDDLGDGNFCLTIKDVREEDFGTIRCVAKNDLGEADTQAEFQKGNEHPDRERDDLRYPPRFNVPLWDRRIPLNDPMFIECHVDANPTATIEWFKDDKKIEPSGHIEIRNSLDGACRLNIIPFTEADTGVYMCVAVNDLGQAETQATYSVEVAEHVEEEHRKEYAPKINPGLEDQTVNAGQPVRLFCKVDAIPRAGVVWYKDGLPLRADSRITMEYDEEGNARLTINDTVENDIGAYRCVATNAHGTINTSCSVGVKVPKTEVKKEGAEPFFTKGLVDIWADRGETFILKCAVTGDPTPEIKWYRNGQLVRNGPRSVVETSPDGTCSLTIKECTMSDEGIYRCEAENKHGKAKTQATAHVQMALGKTEKPKMDEGKPPKFIIELSDMTVAVGSIIDLECKVTGVPNPTVKWSKDGGPIWEDPRYDWNIDEAKGSYQLRIKNATVADEGTYRCVANNENGSATTKSFVRIDDGLGAKSSDQGKPPRFAIKLGDARATEGQPLKLECKVDASPLPEMTWYKDGAIVQPSERIQISLSPDGVATLLIPSCVYDDDGIYRVIATNPSGSAQDKGNATVKKLPKGDAKARSPSAGGDGFDANKAPKLVQPLESVRIPEKQAFTLRCKFSGDPKPTIKWFKDGERVFPYGRLKLNELPDGVCELVIDSAIRQDAGGYRCVAENTYGSARTSCDVNVIRGDRKPRDIDSSIREGKAPGFTIPLTIKRAKPGDSVTFECLPFGNPFPSIKWLKDGLELFSSEKYKIEAAADGTQKLTLVDVQFLSEGYFRCVATNEHGTASTKAELVIDGWFCLVDSVTSFRELGA